MRAGPGGWAREWQVEPAGSFPGLPALDPTGERLAHLGFNGRPPRWPNYFRLDVRDAATGAVIGHGEYPYTRTECRLVFRPDGRQLVGLHAMSVLVWGVPNWGKPRVLRAATRKHVTA
ncbi:MAG: hypothetical protein K2X87_17920, partial [Gemmataceae bacterium]|nr:hypothetical protein [Gemmataceae bacterium]